MNGQYHDPSSLPGWTDGMLCLMYHAIEAPPLFHRLRGLYVDPSLLDEQIRELLSTGVPVVTLSDWLARRPAERRVIITFDDGFQDVCDNALPVLRKHGVTAINYIVAGKIGGTNDWDSGRAQRLRLMDRVALQDWLAGGQEIGAHTVNHVPLAEIPVEKARAEIFDSKRMLEDLFGRPVLHFCYPWGSWNDVVRDLVIEAGYETATSTHPCLNRPDADPFTLMRFAGSHRKPWLAAVRGALLGSRRRAALSS